MGYLLEDLLWDHINFDVLILHYRTKGIVRVDTEFGGKRGLPLVQQEVPSEDMPGVESIDSHFAFF